MAPTASATLSCGSNGTSAASTRCPDGKRACATWIVLSHVRRNDSATPSGRTAATISDVRASGAAYSLEAAVERIHPAQRAHEPVDEVGVVEQPDHAKGRFRQEVFLVEDVREDRARRERDCPAEVLVLRHRKRRFQRVRHRPEIAREQSRQFVHLLARDIARVAPQSLRDLVGGDPLVEPDSQQVDHQDCCPPPNIGSLAPSPTAFPTAWTNAFVRL